MAIQWSLVLFTALTGMAGWMLVPLALDEVRGANEGIRFKVAVVAIALEVVGGIASATHLSHPDRMLGALSHPTSGIFVEAVLVGITIALVVVYVVLLKREASDSARKVFAILGALIGMALSFMAGDSYMMASQQSWNTLLLPLGYLGTAIPSGIAAYYALAISSGIQKDALELHGKMLVAGGIVAAITAAAFALASGNSADFALVIWGIAVVVGGICPAVLGIALLRGDAKKLNPASVAALACLCALAGSIAYRCYMWLCSEVLNNFFQVM